MRPEELPGGPIVLIREGKDVQGFPILAAALAGAADGDIFEVRSDLPQGWADVPPDRGLLTLRAGPGYRPAIAGYLHVRCGSSLAIEGITFLKGSDLKTEWKETCRWRNRAASAAWHPRIG